MELLLAVLIAAYAVKGVGADVAAAVAGKTPPSVLKWEARQKRLTQPKKDPGYLGRIWNNALESWADASTRRHNRRMKARDEWEKRKGPEWVEKKLVKLEKAAARHQRFAEKAGVLWGKAREAAENVRERRREDQAWAANEKFDAEHGDTVPAGLPGSTDLDDDEYAQEATVLPFRSREDDTDTDKPGRRIDSQVCRWGEWEGDTPCTLVRGPGSEYCMDHRSQHQNRCTWGEQQRCRKPRLPGSPYCPQHHTADPKVQAAVESSVGFDRYQREQRPTDDDAEPASSVVHDEDKPSPLPPLHETNAAVDLMTCLWGAEEGNRCTALRLDGSAYCGDHKLMDDLRCKCSDLGGERCTEPVHGRSPFCYDHHTADPDIQGAIEERWGRPMSYALVTDQPAHGGQDSTTRTETKEVQPMTTPNTAVPAEITSLTDAITYTQAMHTSLAAVDAQVDQWSADLKAFAEKARAASTELETAVASLRNNEVEGAHLAKLEAAREHLEAIAAVFGGAAEQVGAASDSAQAGASAFQEAHGAFTAQTGIAEQMQAAKASGNRAGKREFYEVG